MNKERMNPPIKEIDCDIVKDLLPLYHDGVVSETTSTTVKTHLKNCESCTAEYEKLHAVLPAEEVPLPTKDRFKATMKISHEHSILGTLLAIVLTTFILCVGFYILCNEPLSHALEQEATVLKVYKYYSTDRNQDMFFIAYSVPQYTCPSIMTNGYDKNLENAQTYNHLVPVLHNNFDYTNKALTFYSFPAYADCDTLLFGNTVIWTDNAPKNISVPDYVYDLETASQTSYGFTDDNTPFISIRYDNGQIVTWDLDGNIITTK